MIDAHQHFWALGRGDYAWPNAEVAKINRDFLPEELEPLLQAAGISQTVLVQANDTLAETEFLLDIAAGYPWIAAVVGWVDLASPKAEAEITRLAQNPKLKGLRPMLQSISDTDWITAPRLAPALSLMERLGLRFDALIQPRHLPAILQLAQAYPRLQIVIDHCAKPQMGGGRAPDPAWREGMAALGRAPNLWCKLSGLVTEIGPDWQLADLKPYVRHVLASFGPKRLIWGSDWPVVNLASDYATWLETTAALLSDLSDDERAAIMGGNAARFYGL